MFVGKEVEAHVAVRGDDVFRCASCDFHSPCHVYGLGQGEGKSAFFLDNAGAEARAERRAHKAARKDVKRLIELARCPSCHRRDSRMVRRYWLMTLLETIGLGCIGVIAAYVFRAKGATTFIYAWAAFMVVFTLGFLVVRGIKLANMDERVHFPLSESP